jgi:hypothetical protein
MPANTPGDTIKERLARIETKINFMLEHCTQERDYARAMGSRLSVLEGWHGRTTWALGGLWLIVVPILGMWLKARLGL